MSNPAELPAGTSGEALVEPPIVDSLHLDTQQGNWLVTFIPEDSISTREKETVVIPLSSPDGRRISLRLDRLHRLLGSRLTRLYHAGDSRFAFCTDQRTITLDDPLGRRDLPMRAYIELADIAMTAQIAFAGTRAAAR